MTKKQYREIFSQPEWTIESLEIIFDLIDKKAKEYLQLDIYPNQFEIVSADQLLSLYSSIGLPINYPHWKFGKDYMANHNKYLNGRMNLSYEMVSNSNPCISYNIEENDTCLMALVFSHACIGHNSFFKNNYMFKDWTQADSIVNYMKFARNFILECEKKYGMDEVEEFLDAAHSIQNYGTDSYKHPKFSLAKEQKRIQQLLKWEERDYDAVLDKGKKSKDYSDYEELDIDLLQRTLKEPQENILYFLEKHTPKLAKWKRELLRIVRKIAQYFRPQSMSKISNEGWATFCHYHIITKLHEDGYLPDSFMIEFYKHHTNVIFQPAYNDPRYYGLNPYTLGYNIFSDIKRICENPAEEDKEFFPNLAGKNWLEELHFAMNNFRDDSFILQYLSPKVIRDMKLFSFYDDSEEDEYMISHIHDKVGYLKIRELLSKQYNRATYVPNIMVSSVDEENNFLMLEYNKKNDIELNEDERDKVLDYVEYIWGFQVDIIIKEEEE